MVRSPRKKLCRLATVVLTEEPKRIVLACVCEIISLGQSVAIFAQGIAVTAHVQKRKLKCYMLRFWYWTYCNNQLQFTDWTPPFHGLITLKKVEFVPSPQCLQLFVSPFLRIYGHWNPSCWEQSIILGGCWVREILDSFSSHFYIQLLDEVDNGWFSALRSINVTDQEDRYE